MKLVTVRNVAGEVVAVFTATKKDAATKAAALIGGTAADFPTGLNEFASDAASLPKFAEAFYLVTLFKSGKVANVAAMPLLTPAGKLQRPAWAVDCFAKRAAGADTSKAVRKSHWLLTVQVYGDGEQTAIDMAKMILAEIKAGKRKDSGSI